MSEPKPKCPREFTVEATEHLEGGLKRSVTLHLVEWPPATGQVRLRTSGEGYAEIDASRGEEKG